MGIDLVSIFWLVAGYLSGAVPFGLLLARMAGLGDVRDIGSGNIGATNVLRTGSKKVAAATLLADLAKGLVPVLLARFLAGETAAMAAGLGAFFGHLYPVWLKFKGGKGVATYLGVILGLNWVLFFVFALVWLSVAFIGKISSLAALCAVVAVAVVAYFSGDMAHLGLLVVLAILIYFKHRENIARLVNGTESKISFKSGK